MAGRLQNEDSKSLSELTGAGGSASQLLNDTKIYVTANSLNKQLSQAITDGDIGGGGGGKNYLSKIVTSQSSTPNTGNGDFKTGTTTGWGLGTIGTLTNGLPTGTPTFGSGASGNLSISTVSSGTLAGSYSLSYASSAATTQGNMLHSDAFYIDNEDQAKVLKYSFFYKAQTNPSNGNWSGTSSNSFAMAVYDVTNSVWLQVSQPFNMSQSSGIGLAQGDFQTASNTTQLRFVVYNMNATSGAITLYMDDFVVSPSVNVYGTVVTDWKSVTPTGSWNTNVTYSGFEKQIGDTKHYRYKVLCSGAPNAANLTFTIPQTIDTNKIDTAATRFALARIVDSGGSEYDAFAFISGNTIGVYPMNASGSLEVPGTQVSNSSPFSFGSGDYVSIDVILPISGLSSSVQVSDGYDGRLVALSVFKTSAQTISNNTATTVTNYATPSIDKTSSFNATSGEWTAPASAVYAITANIAFVSNSTGVRNHYILKNGSVAQYGTLAAAANGDGNILSSTVILELVAGDKISQQAYQTSGGNLDVRALGTSTGLQIFRLSSPTTISATAVVAARAYNASGSLSSTPSDITWGTVEKDSFGAFGAASSVINYKIPLTGFYNISGQIYTGGTAALNNYFQVRLYHTTTSTLIAESSYSYNGAQTGNSGIRFSFDSVYIFAGTEIKIQAHTDKTAPTVVSNSTQNYLSIQMVK